MNCYVHPDAQATGFCRECGRALCVVCQRPAQGTMFCQEHAPVAAPYVPPVTEVGGAPNPYLQTGPIAPIRTSPALAFALGFIPGVGAIYNGQYLKGMVHVVIFGALITIISEGGGSAAPLLGLTIAGFYFYMAFEAYHTAKKRQAGIPVEEWSSLIAPNRHISNAPIGPILLITVGLLFLLDTLNLIRFHELARFWPVLLIIAGGVMLYNRISGVRRDVPSHVIEHSVMESTRE